MKVKINEKEKSLEVNIAGIKGQKEKLMQSFKDCSEGKCSCPTNEYKKLKELRIITNNDKITLNLISKKEEKFDVEEINKCLTSNLSKIKKERLKQNLELIRKDIGNAKLIAVTKTADISTIKILKDLGQNAFGENRIQDAEPKIKEISAEWHMIGHLQSNKVKKAVGLFDMIQSVDSTALAKKIDNECQKQNLASR